LPRKPTVPNAASEKGEPNTQKTLCHEGVQTSIDVPDVKDVPNVQDSVDVPNVKAVPDVTRTTTHNIFNTKSPENGQTNSWQTSPRPRRSPCLPPPRETANVQDTP
jgi:hypothetical protein